jgi:hypothetical protein
MRLKSPRFNDLKALYAQFVIFKLARSKRSICGLQ